MASSPNVFNCLRSPIAAHASLDQSSPRCLEATARRSIPPPKLRAACSASSSRSGSREIATAARPARICLSESSAARPAGALNSSAAAAGAETVREAAGARNGERVRQAESLEEYSREFSSAEEDEQLLVVEFTRASLPNTARLYDTLVDLSTTTPDVRFLRVMADKSDALQALCERNGVSQIPYYVFFRNGHKVHEQAGMQADRLREQVLYHGAAEYPVTELATPRDLDNILQSADSADKLVVVQVTLNFCGPCAKVYPTVLQLSHKMAGSVVFARLFGDSGDDTRQLLTDLGIVEVPTFLFYRNNALLGRYVGSGRGELVGEVLRYQGVECT